MAETPANVKRMGQRERLAENDKMESGPPEHGHLV